MIESKIIKALKIYVKKIFTLGNSFSKKDLIDNIKKYSIEGIGIFIVISFSFYVENKGSEYEVTKSYLEMLEAFKKDLHETLLYATEYSSNLKDETEIYKQQLERWENDNDSIFIATFSDEDGKFFYPPLAYFNNYNPFKPSKRGFSLFRMGGVDFELIDNQISEEINDFYEVTLFYLEENTSTYDKKYIQDFEDQIKKHWSQKIKNIELLKNEFWIENRKIIQADRTVKVLVSLRLALWKDEINQMENITNRLEETLKNVDSKIESMEESFYFIYWQIF